MVKTLTKVIIAGSRTFDNYDLLKTKCDMILKGYGSIEIVSGKAPGADTLAIKYAHNRGYKLKLFPADWDKLGKSAGYIRNTQMRDYADMLIAFWDGSSKGTRNMIDIAFKKGLIVKVVNYNDDRNVK